MVAYNSVAKLTRVDYICVTTIAVLKTTVFM